MNYGQYTKLEAVFKLLRNKFYVLKTSRDLGIC